MTTQKHDDAPLAYTIDCAASALHMSPDFFRAHVLPEIKVVRRGRRVIVPREELSTWLRRNAEEL